MSALPLSVSPGQNDKPFRVKSISTVLKTLQTCSFTICGFLFWYTLDGVTIDCEEGGVFFFFSFFLMVEIEYVTRKAVSMKQVRRSSPDVVSNWSGTMVLKNIFQLLTIHYVF